MWMIYPVTWPEDSRWQGRTIWDHVVVRAPTASMARVQAAKLDRPRAPHGLGNETHCFRSGLEDERLYWVRHLTDDEASDYTNDETTSLESGVLAAKSSGAEPQAGTGQEIHDGNTAAGR
ncbi:hypothetical protein [Fodinicurvata fenggangensis]|uniref:hypothetical protein n=1 Tax=Fodinicurvata fenggangensis TaxID=1121830 RepID=UPI0004789FC7|nr:hypothetical protein [Fodinicurvata fenggangensis]